MASNQKGESPFQAKQIGWTDEFGNLYPIGAWRPKKATGNWRDEYKAAWRPVYDFSPSELVLMNEQQRGDIAYELTKRLVIDMPTARAAVDAALKP
jgi:hypothetical protein